MEPCLLMFARLSYSQDCPSTTAWCHARSGRAVARLIGGVGQLDSSLLPTPSHLYKRIETDRDRRIRKRSNDQKGEQIKITLQFLFFFFLGWTLWPRERGTVMTSMSAIVAELPDDTLLVTA